MEILRKRNATCTIYFPMIVRGAADFATNTDWTPASGDIEYSVDGGAFTTTATATPTHEGGGIWSLAIAASEVNGRITVIKIVDQTATKEVEDQSIIICTYGDDSAEIHLNDVADHVIRRTWANAEAATGPDTKTGRSLLGAIAKLVNRLAISGGTLTIYEDDDSTSLFTQAVTTNAAADPITQLDTT